MTGPRWSGWARPRLDRLASIILRHHITDRLGEVPSVSNGVVDGVVALAALAISWPLIPTSIEVPGVDSHCLTCVTLEVAYQKGFLASSRIRAEWDTKRPSSSIRS